MLPPRGLVNRHRDDRLFELARNAVAEIRFPAADLAERVFATGLVQLLEAIEAVAAVAHHLAGLGDIPELLGELQHADCGLDDLLLSRHALSMSACQITS